MSKTITNKLSMVLYLLVGSFVLELICFHTLKFGFLPQYWLYDFAIVLFVAMIIFAIPNYTAQYVISTIILLIHTILIYANYTLYIVYGGEIFTFEMFKLLKEAADASNSTFFNYVLVTQLILVFIALSTIGFYILKRCKKQKISFKKHYAMVLIVVFAMLELVSLGTVFGYRQTINAEAEHSSDYVASDSFLMNTSFMKESSYRKFGTYGFYLNLMLGGYQANADKTKAATIDYFNKGNIYGQTKGENGEVINPSPVFGVDSGNNVIVIMMESLEWFAFEDGSKFDPELKNLSYELAPNIYNLIKGDSSDTATETGSSAGMVATNFFSKSKTNISEGYSIMGNYPIGKSLTDIAYKNYDITSNTFGYTLPSVLKSLGYNTSYVHSHTMEFYDRKNTHKNIGFGNLIGKNDILDENGKQKYTGNELSFHHWLPEGDFVDETMKYIIPEESVRENEKFFTFYLNVSTHGDYSNNPNNGDQVRYKQYVMYGEDDCVLNADGDYVLNPTVPSSERTATNFYKNLQENYSKEVCDRMVNYMSAVMGLDEAVGKIVAKLKSLDIYDQTTMLLFSDHYAYYDGLTYDMKGLVSGDDKTIIEANTIPFIISSPGIKRTESLKDSYIDLFCSAYDIVPTLFDLLGISFNENLYTGSSLFKPYEVYQVSINDTIIDVPLKVYYSNVGGIFSNYGYTYNLASYQTVKGAQIKENDINLIKQECTKVLTKLYYLDMLNSKSLFNDEKFTNKKFENSLIVVPPTTEQPEEPPMVDPVVPEED